jgi:hypothetical protein
MNAPEPDAKVSLVSLAWTRVQVATASDHLRVWLVLQRHYPLAVVRDLKTIAGHSAAKGNRTCNVEPPPSGLVIVIVPPSASILSIRPTKGNNRACDEHAVGKATDRVGLQ